MNNKKISMESILIDWYTDTLTLESLKKILDILALKDSDTKIALLKSILLFNIVNCLADEEPDGRNAVMNTSFALSLALFKENIDWISILTIVERRMKKCQ